MKHPPQPRRTGRLWLPKVRHEEQHQVRRAWVMRSGFRPPKPGRLWMPGPRREAPVVANELGARPLTRRGSSHHRTGGYIFTRVIREQPPPYVPRGFYMRGTVAKDHRFNRRPLWIGKPAREALSFTSYGGVYRHVAEAFNPAGTTTLRLYMRATAGTVYAQLYDLTAASVAPGSGCSTSNVAFDVVESGGIALTDHHDYRVQLGGGSGEIYNAMLVCHP